MHIHQDQRLVQLKPEEMREKRGSWLETLTLSMESWLHTRGKRPNASNSGPKGFTHILLPEALFPTPKNSCRAAKKKQNAVNGRCMEWVQLPLMQNEQAREKKLDISRQSFWLNAQETKWKTLYRLFVFLKATGSWRKFHVQEIHAVN